jgi:hypothetical protein
MARNTMYLLLFINGPSRNTLNSFITSNANFEAQLVSSGTDSCNNNLQVPFIAPNKQSDGGAIINKLQFGTTQFNLLVMGSLVLYPHLSNTTSIGPGFVIRFS